MEPLVKKDKELAIKQFLAYLITDAEKQISDIITRIRALNGVITVSIFEATRSISKTKHLTKVKFKFLQYAHDLEEQIKLLKKSILHIDGISSVTLKLKRADLHPEQVRDVPPKGKPSETSTPRVPNKLQFTSKI